MKTVLLDATAVKGSSCIKHIYLKNVEGYCNAVNSSDIEFGSAFHAFAKVRDETGNDLLGLAEAGRYWKEVPKSVKRGKEFLNDSYLTSCCEAYPAAFPLSAYEKVIMPSGKPFVEQRIAYPYYVTPERDIEVILCGTIDKLLYNTISGHYAIFDYKTTSVWDSAKYFASYELSTQLMMYKLLLTLYAKLLPSNELLQKIVSKPLACVVEGIFLGKDKPPRFERSKEFWYSDKRMAEFEKGLRKFIVDKYIPAIRNPAENVYREGMLNSSCEKVYGMCDFASVCSAPEEQEEELMRTMFVKRTYNPLTHGEIKAA